MIEIDGKIISTDILTTKFCCDIAKCKGICCVEGNSGAPLEIEEVDILESEYNNYKEYMTPEGREVIDNEGFMIVDLEGDYTTPLVNDSECAFSFKDGDITLCAIEKAYKEGKTTIYKPISCHLYPIRVANFSNGSIGLNYHRWGVCSSALENGSKVGVPMYKMLQAPITMRFGADFYEALEVAAKFIDEQKK